MSVKHFGHGGEVLRSGLLKKLKTSRKKWFVLRAETPDSSARLEYYDSEKKFNSGTQPKRSIALRNCFNINKRHDTKHKNVIALYTKDDCFCVVLDSEDEMEAWLKALLSLQQGEEDVDGQTPRPMFEHVWQVSILNRGLGTGRTGNYVLCLTAKTLSLIKKDCKYSVINLKLSNIRSCGSLRNYFFLEVGRSSLLGAGELWMESEDAMIAQNIHATIFHAMSTHSNESTFNSRTRSSSATESSKPNNSYRKQILSGLPKSHVFPQDPNASSIDSTEVPTAPSTVTETQVQPHGVSGIRDRSDSMPSHRPRAISEGTHPIPVWKPLLTPFRSHGRDISHSPPSGSPVSPPSVGCSTDSTGSSYSLADETDMCAECPESLRYSVALTPEEAIAEEDCPESPCGVYDSRGPKAQPSLDDAYMDMLPPCHHNTNSPTASVSSIASGTPTTDIRFADYPLDKVSSYLPSEEEDPRPARAYSVGSRPETYRGKRHMELIGTPENSRVRAFSVGSKTKKGPSRVLPPHHPHPGVKSSSAPMLSNSRSHSSHSSIGPMDDLMEMDFSRSNTASSTASGYAETKQDTTPSGYVEMKPGVDLTKKSTPTTESPYVDMSSGAASYVDMSRSSPSRIQLGSPQGDYPTFQHRNTDVDQIKHKTAVTKPLASPGTYAWGGDYLDMSGGNQSRKSERGSFSSQLSSPSVSVSPKNDYMPLSLYLQDANKQSGGKKAQTPDGYVEMTPGPKHQRQSSLDSSRIVCDNEDYTNMSPSSLTKKKSVKKEKTQPISIYPTTSSQMTKHSSSPMSISSLLGRKSSTGTPPKMHLPLTSWSTSPYSSLPRQRTRKDSSNTNSKDSSSSSITTPSNSSTIFPLSLNSPSSPMKPASKTETPTALKIPNAIFNAFYKSNNKGANAASSSNSDYTVMDFEFNKNKAKNNNTGSDYLNYAPGKRLHLKAKNDLSSDDYALMSPGSDSFKITPVSSKSTPDGVSSPLINHLSSIDIRETQSMCFRPIQEHPKFGSSSPMSTEAASLITEEAKTSTSNMETDESSGEAALVGESAFQAAKMPRPNSVNSDKLKTSSPCPSSASERSRPSSVSSETSKGVVSRPGSTSSELWSSSSTLVGSRPESVNSDPIQQDCVAGSNVFAVKSDVKVHYARLNLVQSQEDEDCRSTRTSASSPNETSKQEQGEPTFVYAEIDFLKSDGLKQNNQSLLSNARVQH